MHPRLDGIRGDEDQRAAGRRREAAQAQGQSSGQAEDADKRAVTHDAGQRKEVTCKRDAVAIHSHEQASLSSELTCQTARQASAQLFFPSAQVTQFQLPRTHYFYSFMINSRIFLTVFPHFRIHTSSLWQEDCNGERGLYVSSMRLRDQLLVAALHAGFSARADGDCRMLLRPEWMHAQPPPHPPPDPRCACRVTRIKCDPRCTRGKSGALPFQGG